MDIMPRGVDRTVDDEGGRIDSKTRGVGQDIAIHINFYEARCGNFIMHQAERIN